MPVLLQINASPMGANSISRTLTREFVQRWRNRNPQGRVITRDLTTIVIPVIDRAWIAANYTPKESRTEQQHDLLALSTEFTKELLDADEYVIGVPMHNWGPSSSFKLWTDQIVRFGETIALTPTSMKGTLGQKRATFFVAAGRNFSSHSPDHGKNHLEPWLRTFFGGLGIRDMRFVFAEGTAAVRHGTIGRAAFLAPHIETMQSLLK
jgi:FMN-dependent NADH-azoreductase